MIKWELQRCWAGKGIKEDEEKMEILLADGWQPFAVTSSGQAGYVYHFRRKVTFRFSDE